MTRLNRSFPLITAVTALLAACQDVDPPTDPLAPAQEPAAAADLEQEVVVRPHEAHFHKLAGEIRSFGGYFFDEAGNLIVYVADPADEGRARELLYPMLKEREPDARQRRVGDLVVTRADYSFLQLAGWRDRSVDPVLSQEGVQYVDLDEVQNRIAVGVSSSSGKEQAARVLAEHKVPLEAVVFEESRGATEFLTLRDFNRPLEGGYQIASKAGTCTLGFNAYRAGTRGFMTNSHCTPTFWGYDGVAVYQHNTSSGANLVGYEWADPAPASCYFGILRCRWSDAAFIRTNTSVKANHGYIARTKFWATGSGNSGSLDVDAGNPRMKITSEYSFPVGGEMFDKMGRTTGWTYGFVHKTCVDHSKGGNRLLRCQDWIRNMHATFGDSGSPIFRWYGSTVRLAGLLWGGTTSGGKQYIIMSAMWNIEKDLGSLGTF